MKDKVQGIALNLVPTHWKNNRKQPVIMCYLRCRLEFSVFGTFLSLSTKLCITSETSYFRIIINAFSY
jgi:hypothetical protein